MPTDFYGIDIEAALIVPINGGLATKRYDLWLGGGASDPTLPALLSDISFVQQVTVQIGLSLNSKVTVTLSPPLEEGLDLINSTLISWAGSQLEVSIGYSTGTSFFDRKTIKFGGTVMKPDVRIGTDISITLSALGLAYGMNLSNATSGGSFGTDSPWEAVKKTLIQNGIDVSGANEAKIFAPNFQNPAERTKSPTNHPFFRSPTRSKKDPTTGVITSEPAPIEKGPRNDWWFMREVVKNAGLDLIVIDHQNIQIKDPELWRAGDISATFVLKGPIDTDQNVYPILEFSSPSAFVWLGQGIGGVFQSDISEDQKIALITKTLLPVKAPPPNAITGVGVISDAVNELIKVTRTEPGGYQSTAAGRNDGSQIIPGSPEDAQREAVINEFKNYQNNKGIQCVIGTIGCPHILPGEVIAVDGLIAAGQVSNFTRPDNGGPGTGFNGKYGVMMVEHDIGTSGMTTKITGLMNAFPISHGGAATADTVNQKQIDYKDSFPGPTKNTIFASEDPTEQINRQRTPQ